MISSGYFLARRAWWHDPVLACDGPMTRREAWTWLVGAAMFERHGALERGQLEASFAMLARQWRWTDRRQARSFLELLERHGRIRREKSVITIVCYDKYQRSSGPQKPPRARAQGAHSTRDWRPAQAHLDCDENAIREDSEPGERPGAARSLLGTRPAGARTKNPTRTTNNLEPSPLPPRGTADGAEEDERTIPLGIMDSLGKSWIERVGDGGSHRVWVCFDTQPPDSVTASLRTASWRYMKADRTWWSVATDAAVALATHLFGKRPESPDEPDHADRTTQVRVEVPMLPGAPLDALPGCVPPSWWGDAIALVRDELSHFLEPGHSVATLRLADSDQDSVRLVSNDRLQALLAEKTYRQALMRAFSAAAGHDCQVNIEWVAATAGAAQ